MRSIWEYGQEHTRATLGLPVGQTGGRSLATDAGRKPTALLPGTLSFKGSFTSVLPGTGWQLPALSSLWSRGCLLAPTGQSSACLYQMFGAYAQLHLQACSLSLVLWSSSWNSLWDFVSSSPDLFLRSPSSPLSVAVRTLSLSFSVGRNVRAPQSRHILSISPRPPLRHVCCHTLSVIVGKGRQPFRSSRPP